MEGVRRLCLVPGQGPVPGREGNAEDGGGGNRVKRTSHVLFSWLLNQVDLSPLV